MLSFICRYVGVSFGCGGWKGGSKAFWAGLALPSLSSRGAEVTQLALLGNPDTHRLLLQQEREKKLCNTFLHPRKNRKERISWQNQPKIYIYIFFFPFNGVGNLSNVAFTCNSPPNRSQGVATAEQLTGYAAAEGPGALLQHKLTERHWFNWLMI